MSLPLENADWTQWNCVVQSFNESKYELRIAICGKYTKLADSYVSINEALKIAGAYVSARVNFEFIETEILENQSNPEILENVDGILVPGGFGPRGTEGKITSIRHAREKNKPFLGLCLGFQLAAVEFARHICGFEEANSTELDPSTPNPVVDLLPEQNKVDCKGATMRLGASQIVVKNGTLACTLYGTETIYERHRHRYEINPKYIPSLSRQGLVFSGNTPDGTRMEILELPSHFFFLGTQYHPEFKTRLGRPDPAFYGFVKAALDRKLGKERPEFDPGVSENIEAHFLRR